jgi:hypothetical protein
VRCRTGCSSILQDRDRGPLGRPGDRGGLDHRVGNLTGKLESLWKVAEGSRRCRKVSGDPRGQRDPRSRRRGPAHPHSPRL